MKTMTRLVVALGRDARVDMHEMVHDAWQSHLELVILSMGFPLTREQNAAIDVAMEAAGQGLLELEARICYMPDQAAAKIRPDDRVVLALANGERRALRRALRKRAGATG